MGCNTSKHGDGPVDTADINIDASASASGVPELKAKPKTGTFETAIQARNRGVKSFSEQLVTRNMQNLREVYDVDDAHVLGRGACGSVCVVRKRNNPDAVFAMKTVALDGVNGVALGQTIDELRKEIEIQKSLDHPNIARIYEYFEDPTNGQMHIIMELCRGGALVSRMKTHRNGYGERAAATLVEKMLSAILYCHNQGVVHRDLKLDNYIYEDEREDAELKLIDFGFAVEVQPGNEWMWEQIGTPSYMSPELWADYSKAYDSSVDMWAIGVCAYMLLSGKRPFHSSDRKEKKRMIMQDPVRFESAEWHRVSSHGKDFCTQLMQKDPKKRLGASQALNHPWIKSLSTLREGTDAAEELESHRDIVKNLEEFAKADNMKKIAMEVIAFSTPPDKLDELRDLFVKMDENGSGTISEEEFVKAMHAQYSPEEAIKLFRLIDINESKEIEYMEFISATMSKRSEACKPSLMSAFSILDRDKNGVISREELRAILGDEITDDELTQMIAEAGGDGGINYEQFKSLMIKPTSDSQRSLTWKSASKITAIAHLRLSSASLSNSASLKAPGTSVITPDSTA